MRTEIRGQGGKKWQWYPSSDAQAGRSIFEQEFLKEGYWKKGGEEGIGILPDGCESSVKKKHFCTQPNSGQGRFDLGQGRKRKDSPNHDPTSWEEGLSTGRTKSIAIRGFMRDRSCCEGESVEACQDFVEFKKPWNDMGVGMQAKKKCFPVKKKIRLEKKQRIFVSQNTDQWQTLRDRFKSVVKNNRMEKID